jgi:hypothetical protein
MPCRISFLRDKTIPPILSVVRPEAQEHNISLSLEIPLAHDDVLLTQLRPVLLSTYTYILLRFGRIFTHDAFFPL